jgi:hypothetical protein
MKTLPLGRIHYLFGYDAFIRADLCAKPATPDLAPA